MLPIVHIYSPKHFEKWDRTAPFTVGIGGSETSHIQMALGLAGCGYEVRSYTPLPKERYIGRVAWLDIADVNFEDDGLWIVYREPKAAAHLKGRQVWVICQDIDYPDEWTPEAVANITYVFALCEDHANYLVARHPELKDKMRITTNGIDSEMIGVEDASFKVERNPYRLMYASSPDRGLLRLTDIFKRALEFVPELELHCYYGFNNLEKAAEKFPTNLKFIDDIKRATDHPRIFFHGRVNQTDLHYAWKQSSFWCHPTNFCETNCITSMEAQAWGAIPICPPLWALREKVKYGILIDGNPDDKLVAARYLGELLRLLSDPDLQERIRVPMMEFARQAYGWSDVVDAWDKLIRKDYATL